MVWWFDFNNIMYLAQQTGFFTVLLPFLLIFSIVYAILIRVEIFKKTPAAGAIVALVIAFMALLNYQIAWFMARLFSNIVIGLLVLLTFVILFGLLNKDITSKAGWFFFVVVIIIAIVAIYKAFQPNLAFLYAYAPVFFPLAFIIVAIVLIVVFSREKPLKKSFSQVMQEALFGEGREH
jgi:hypothetical protein